MIAAIIFILLGVLTLVLAVVFRKKLFKSAPWLISVAAVAAVFFTAGGMKLSGRLTEIQDSREKIYLGSVYLKSFDIDSASFYISAASVTDNCPAASAKYLLEKLRGNDLSARLYLDAAESYAKKEEELDLVEMLPGIDVYNTEQIDYAAESIEDILKISDSRKSALDLYISGEWSGADDEDLKSLGLKKGEIERLEISSLLSVGNYNDALTAAVELADGRPTEKNRLLLASVIAEGAYNGVVYTAKDFATLDHKRDKSVAKEKEKLSEQLEDAQKELQSVEIALSGDKKSEASVQRLNERKLELTEKVSELTKRSDKLFVYRAFNAIADLHSLNARIVRARLYYALDEYDKSVKELIDAANSLDSKLSSDRRLSTLLGRLRDAYSSEEAYYGGSEFRETVKEILSAPFDDLVYSAHSGLTESFADRVISDQKVYGKSIQISGIDASEFPKITLNVTGKENVLQQIADRQEVTVKDTHSEITEYTAELSSGTDCCVAVVADVSGSMDGDPLRNLKEALYEFISTSSDGISVSLVAFESYSRLIAPLTDDKATLLTKIDELYGGGGTDITRGIREGMDSLENAGANKVMLLMTDGQSGIDYNVVDEAAAKGIVIHTIGFGGVDAGLLQEIADRTGGQFVLADSSAELVNVYASLQQIIGNSLKVEYTVSDVEDINRYFFVRVGEYSAYREYTIESKNTDPVVYYSTSGYITTDTIESDIRWNNSISLSLIGENLMGVETVSVGGLSAEIRSKYSDRLDLWVSPSLSTGWQTVKLTLADGTVKTYDRLIYVGDPVRFMTVSLGDLYIEGVYGLKDGQDLVLFGDFSLIDDLTHASVSAKVSGILTVPYTGSIENASSAVINVGEKVSAECYGQINLNRADSAFISSEQSPVASGQMTLELERGSSKVILADRGDEI